MTEESPDIIEFNPAVRKGSHVLIGLYGESGCGKTLSALLLARGLVGDKGKIGLMDTETGRALVYSNKVGGFAHADLTAPYTPERYIAGLKAADRAGFDVMIIDSASHEWEGIGGVVEIADASSSKGLVKWTSPKARHKKLVQHLLNTRMHLIICMRAKEKMEQRKNPNTGKEEIVSKGFFPVQDKRLKHEMTVLLFLTNEPGKEGIYVREKCPEDLHGAFPGAGERISVETGRKVSEWVAGGAIVDHAFEALKHAAADHAEKGVESFREYFKSLTAEQRASLKTSLPNLQSIAETADEEKARIEKETADVAFNPAKASVI